MGDHRLHRLALGRATGPAIPTSSSPSTSRSRSIWPRGPRASPPLLWRAFPSSDRSWSRDARSIRRRPSVTVQAIYDADSIALLVRWHDMSAQKTGKNGPSLPVPLEEEEAPAIARGRWPAPREAYLAMPKSRRLRPGSRRIPLPRRLRQATSRPNFPTRSRSRFPRRRRRRPASPTSSSATPRTRWISGSSIWPPQSLRFTGKGSGDVAPERHGRSHRCRELRPGRMVGHLQAAPSRQPRPPRSRPEQFMPVAFSVWDGFSRERGNRRGLTLWYSLYVEPETVPSAVGPMVRTALIILAIELALIGWVRWNHGSRDYGKLGGEPRHRRPPGRERRAIRRIHVQEHLRSRR